MSRTIFVHNKSGHPQTFEVHGWDNNKNLTVAAHSTAKISAPDHSSGAIIALHNGHEGEQAEITKDGFGGNDFVDLSNIVGAGGNMTVAQADDLATAKGDPNFMQDLNKAWHKASQQTKTGLSNCVHLDNAGDVVRIEAIKDFPNLEKFVRSFADGMTYIGVGSWNGNPGNENDNKQSSAAHGNKDIIVTYSDGNANPGPDVVHGTVSRATASAGIASNNLQGFSPDVDAEQLQPGQIGHLSRAVEAVKAPKKDDGPGIELKNKSSKTCTYYFYDNFWNGNGTAGANFDKPLKNVTLSPGHSQFVSLPTTFKGRVQRGTQIPCTWAEFQIEASNDHAAHGDISVEQGNDGGAWIRSTDGRNSFAGFSGDFELWGSAEAYQMRKDGVRALASTMGNWLGGPNQAAIKCQQDRIGKTAYVTGGTGVPDVASKNRRLIVEFE